MFSGIIEKQGRVVSVSDHDSIRGVRIRTPRGWKPILGESISVNGVCSTVARKRAGTFDVEYMPETLSKTTAGSIIKGASVNLERSLVYGSRIHGHFVQGHVDAAGRVVAQLYRGRACDLTVAIPRALMRYIALHGSITINGVALTVSRRGPASCTVSLIPHTLSRTNLRQLSVGDQVNIEVDMLARYGIARISGGGRVKRHAKKTVRKKA